MKRELAFVLGGFGLGVICVLGQRSRLHEKAVPAEMEGAVQPASRTPEVVLREWTWPDVEDPDYVKLAANLKMVECPEPTIHDLLHARINRKYSELMLRNPMSKYWETSDEKKQRDENLAALKREKESLLQSLGIHSKSEQRAPSPAASPFSPDKMQQIAKINQQYPQTVLPPEPTPEEYRESFDNRAARLQFLQQYLTPDELTQYRLTQDSNASVVTKLLRVINGTPAEINSCAFAFDFTPASINDGAFTPEASQALQAGLGDQRYAQLLAAFNPANVQFSQFIMQTDVTPEEVTQLQQLQQQNLDSASMQNSVTQLLGAQLAHTYFAIVRGH